MEDVGGGRWAVGVTVVQGVQRFVGLGGGNTVESICAYRYASLHVCFSIRFVAEQITTIMA